MYATRKPSSLPLAVSRRSVLSLVISTMVAGLLLVAGPVGETQAATLRHTFTGAPGFPELGGPGEVLSIDAATSSAPGGSATYTTLGDLVVAEDHPNEFDPMFDGVASFVGTGFTVEAPAPFAFLPGSGAVSVVRADAASVDCGSLGAVLSVSANAINIVFRRADAINRCLVTVSGVKVIPTAATPLVPLALLTASSSSPGIGGTVGVLALTSSQGATPTITLTSSPGVTTWGSPTVLTATLGPNGANRQLRLEQFFDEPRGWTAADVVTTNANGVATYSQVPRFNRFYRVVFVGGNGLAAGVSNALRVPVRFKATLSPLHSTVTTIRRGTTITFTIRVQPVVSYVQRPYVKFRLYHRSSTGWRLATTKVLTVDAGGWASWKRTFAVAGEWYVRAQVDQTYANSASLPTPITRYRVR